METFDIFVRSPFGKYKGQISFSRSNGKVEGVLNFLHFSADFSGAASDDEISFKGFMETPIGKLDFEARAVIRKGLIEGSAITRLGVMTFSSKEGR